MKRRLFNILAALSLVLCLATAGLWVRSYWNENWYFGPQRSSHSGWDGGVICLGRGMTVPETVGAASGMPGSSGLGVA